MIIAFLLFVLQAGLLVVTNMMAGRDGAGEPLARAFNPVSFMFFFYTLFFLLPQAFGLLQDGFILAYAPYDTEQRMDIFVSTQIHLIVFLSAIAVAFLILPAPPTPAPATWAHRQTPKRDETTLLMFFFALGMVGLSVLAYRSFHLTGFRSELTRSWDGRILTALSFFANFAVAMLLLRGMLLRRFALALITLTIFAPAILMTGARGRLIWPILLAYAGYCVIRGRVGLGRSLVLAASLLLVLLVLDPLRALVLGTTTEGPDLLYEVARMFERHTFDGFSNFAQILSEDLVWADPVYLVSGTQAIFMEAYHAETYRMGVGFGATLPGHLYLSGGVPGLLLGGFSFGLMLAAINLMLRYIGDPWLLYSYFFAAIWLTAIGGNLMESLDKLVAASFPGLLGYALLKRPWRGRPPVAPVG